jgi:hypothetical protein
VVSSGVIAGKIRLIRGKKVIFDSDLAALYGVETKQLKRAVKRNIERFPEDFMFELTREESDNLRCQIGTSSWGGKRYLPYAFTEQGVAMLSSVLNSKRAIQVNIAIMRVFVAIKEMLLAHKESLLKINKLEQRIERKFDKYDKDIELIFSAIQQLLVEKEKPKRQIGFHVGK